jgi:hypothetical protein
VIGFLVVSVRYLIFFTRHCHNTVVCRRTVRNRQSTRAGQRYFLTRSAGKRCRLDLVVPLPPRGMPVEGGGRVDLAVPLPPRGMPVGVGGRGTVAPRIMFIMTTLHAWLLDVFVVVFV